MKKGYMIGGILLVSLLSGCASSKAYDTPKSEELTAQYEFYPDAQKALSSGMEITPEQADEVFLILTACGLDAEISEISEKDGVYTIVFDDTSLDITLTDGAVETVSSKKEVLYQHNILMNYEVQTGDVKSGIGDKKLGEYAYISMKKSDLQSITEENYKEFAETVVKDSGYNWVAILCDDGTGICFPGSMSYVATYGAQDTDGTILEAYGTITLNENGGYTYEEAENIALKQAIHAAIEDANVEKEAVNILDTENDSAIIELYLKGRDNLSTKTIRKGMWMRTNKILQSLQDRTDFQEIRIFWSFPLLDAYGNSFEDTVMKVVFTKDTLDQINFDAFIDEYIPSIADEYYQHAALSD